MSQEKIAAALEEMLTEMQERENTGYMSEAISSVATELRTRLAALRAQPTPPVQEGVPEQSWPTPESRMFGLEDNGVG